MNQAAKIFVKMSSLTEKIRCKQKQTKQPKTAKTFVKKSSLIKVSIDWG